MTNGKTEAVLTNWFMIPGFDWSKGGAIRTLNWKKRCLIKKLNLLKKMYGI